MLKWRLRQHCLPVMLTMHEAEEKSMTGSRIRGGHGFFTLNSVETYKNSFIYKNYFFIGNINRFMLY